MVSSSTCIEKELTYERTDDMSVLSTFNCGIFDMDEFIHGGLQNAILRKGLDTYIVRQEQDIVAILSVCNKSLESERSNRELIDYQSKEIEYLAVRKDKRNNGIGRNIINWIEDNLAQDLKLLSVSAYIDVDSKYSAEPFYLKCGFIRISDPTHDLADHVRMVKFL